jgi:hypothetical protein
MLRNDLKQHSASFLFREMILNVILHGFCVVETGEIPMKRPAVSSCFVCREIIFLRKMEILATNEELIKVIYNVRLSSLVTLCITIFL